MFHYLLLSQNSFAFQIIFETLLELVLWLIMGLTQEILVETIWGP